MARRFPRFTWRVLQWPRPLDWDTAHGFMHRLVADPNLGPVAIETRANQTQIEYRIGAAKSHISALQALACDLVPGVQISPPDTDRRPIQVAAKVLVTHPTLALETSRVEALTRSVLAGMSGLKKGEQVVLQLLIGSRLTPSLATGATSHQSWWSLLDHGVKPASRQEINRSKTKCTQHGSLATLRIGASATNSQGAKQIVQQLFGGLRMAEAAGVRLRLAPDKPERLNQTPGGILLHGIMSSIAEFYSRNLANEVIKGMSQKARNGQTYPYFVCSNRQRNRTACQFKAVLIHEVEEQIANIYKGIQIAPEQRQQIENSLLEELEHIYAQQHTRVANLKRQRTRLQNQQTKLLQAHYADAIPLDLLKAEQAKISSQITEIDHQLKTLTADKHRVQQHLNQALDLLQNCHQLYTYPNAPDHLKKLLNLVFFDHITINPQDEPNQPPHRKTTPTYQPPFDQLTKPHQEPGKNGPNAQLHEPRGTKNTPQGQTSRGENHIYYGDVSCKHAMVELRGFEPLTFSLRTRRATNCAIAPGTETDATTAGTHV